TCSSDSPGRLSAETERAELVRRRWRSKLSVGGVQVRSRRRRASRPSSGKVEVVSIIRTRGWGQIEIDVERLHIERVTSCEVTVHRQVQATKELVPRLRITQCRVDDQTSINVNRDAADKRIRVRRVAISHNRPSAAVDPVASLKCKSSIRRLAHEEPGN